MNNYLKENFPKATFILVLLLFIANQTTHAFPALGKYLLLFPSDLKDPLNWYRLLTYALFVFGIKNWLYISIPVILIGFIIEHRVKPYFVPGLIVLSAIVGGLMFAISSQGDPDNIPLGSPTMISWGYWAAAIVVGLKNLKNLNLFEKIVISLLFISVLSLWPRDLSLFFGEITVVIVTVILTLTDYERIKAE